MRKRDWIEDQIQRVKFALSLVESGDYQSIPE